MFVSTRVTNKLFFPFIPQKKVMLNLLKKDTIFALSSAPGKAGVAIIRISGSNVYNVTARKILSKDLIWFGWFFFVPIIIRKYVIPDVEDSDHSMLYTAGGYFTFYLVLIFLLQNDLIFIGCDESHT